MRARVPGIECEGALERRSGLREPPQFRHQLAELKMSVRIAGVEAAGAGKGLQGLVVCAGGFESEAVEMF